jgi:hypothetical protein
MTTGKSPAEWADAIAARVGTYGNGLWLPELGEWLGFVGTTWPPAFPEKDEQVTKIPVPVRALQLELYALPSYRQASPRTRLHHIVLKRVIFDAETVVRHPQEAALPFGLDAEQDTPALAEEKLGNPGILYQGKGKDAGVMSWELNDNRVVEVIFQTQSAGIRRVQMVRLWSPIQFDAKKP